MSARAQLMAAHAQLQDIPFAQLQQLQQRLGAERFRELLVDKSPTPPTRDEPAPKRQRHIAHGSGESFEEGGAGDEEISTHTVSKKKSSKHRPRELSSKAKPPGVRTVVKVAKKFARDPRFDDLSGALKGDIFEHQYAFLHDVQAQEKREVVRRMKKTNDADEKEQLARLVQRMSEQERQKIATREAAVLRRTRRKDETTRVAAGKAPYFLKKADEKKIALLDEYTKLQQTGGLQKKLKAKRRRTASELRSRLPDDTRRRAEDAA